MLSMTPELNIHGFYVSSRLFEMNHDYFKQISCRLVYL